MRGAAEFGPMCDAAIADRLRRLCTPQLAAVTALALALGLGPHALAYLRIDEVAPSGAALELRTGERRAILAQLSAMIRAHLIQRRNQGAQAEDVLFSRKDGAPLSTASLRRILNEVRRRLGLCIPALGSSTAASVSWTFAHHLTFEPLPVFPMTARQWTLA